MKNFYQEVENGLKELIRIRTLMAKGLAKMDDKRICHDICDTFIDKFGGEHTLRAEKLHKSISTWTRHTRDGFVPEDEVSQIDPWIIFFQEFLDTKKKKSSCDDDSLHAELVIDKDHHIFLGEKGSSDHTHTIISGKTGEIRFDPKDQNPENLIESIEATIKLKNGKTLKIVNQKIEFGNIEKNES